MQLFFIQQIVSLLAASLLQGPLQAPSLPEVASPTSKAEHTPVADLKRLFLQFEVKVRTCEQVCSPNLRPARSETTPRSTRTTMATVQVRILSTKDDSSRLVKPKLLDDVLHPSGMEESINV
jgi:hypothetical protein